jgi:hypothetical protein
MYPFHFFIILMSRKFAEEQNRLSIDIPKAMEPTMSSSSERLSILSEKKPMADILVGVYDAMDIDDRSLM